MEHLADEALMEAYQQGDTRAFEQLLNRHQRGVYNFLCRQVGSPNVAEDLMQEVFLRVIQGAAAYKKQAKFTTWLYTIARNLCIDHGRRSKHRKAISLDKPLENKKGDGGKGTMSDQIADSQAGVDRQVIGHELQDHLLVAIQELKDDQREVFLMREYLDLSFKEIGEIVGCPENTVKSRMRYALEDLRVRLSEYTDMARAMV